MRERATERQGLSVSVCPWGCPSSTYKYEKTTGCGRGAFIYFFRGLRRNCIGSLHTGRNLAAGGRILIPIRLVPARPSIACYRTLRGMMQGLGRLLAGLGDTLLDRRRRLARKLLDVGQNT